MDSGRREEDGRGREARVELGSGGFGWGLRVEGGWMLEGGGLGKGVVGFVHSSKRGSQSDRSWYWDEYMDCCMYIIVSRF